MSSLTPVSGSPHSHQPHQPNESAADRNEEKKQRSPRNAQKSLSTGHSQPASSVKKSDSTGRPRSLSVGSSKIPEGPVKTPLIDRVKIGSSSNMRGSSNIGMPSPELVRKRINFFNDKNNFIPEESSNRSSGD